MSPVIVVLLVHCMVSNNPLLHCDCIITYRNNCRIHISLITTLLHSTPSRVNDFLLLLVPYVHLGTILRLIKFQHFMSPVIVVLLVHCMVSNNPLLHCDCIITYRNNCRIHISLITTLLHSTPSRVNDFLLLLVP